MLASWGATLAVITVRDLGINIPGLQQNPKCKGHRIGGLPAPGDYLATFIVYAPLMALSGRGGQAARFADLFGWGWFLGVVALPCLGTSNPTGKSQQQATGGAGKNTKTTGA